MYISDFIDYLKLERNYSEKTLIAYKKDIEQYYSYLCLDANEMFLKALNINNARSWLMELMSTGYSSTSVNRKLSSLRVYSRFLFRKGLIDNDVLSILSGPKEEKKLPVFVRASEMDDLLSEKHFTADFEGIRDRLIIEILYSTGMRLAELVGLNNKDIDVQSMQIKVLGKGSKERLIPFGGALKSLIEDYIKERSLNVEVEDEAFLVLLNGKRIYRSLVYNLVNKKLEEVSTLTKRSPHVLRHSFATNMLNNGADLQVIKEILGHTSLAATEVYTHTTFSELKKVYKQAHPRA